MLLPFLRSKIMSIAIPGYWATAGYGVPAVCAKHGRPEVRRAKTTPVSPIPGWMYALIVAGFMIFIIVRVATRKALTIPAWPFCESCVRRRTTRLWAAIATIAVGTGAFVLAAGDWIPGGPATGMAGLFIVMAGVIGLVPARWSVIAGAKLSDDGFWITVRNPHPEFMAQFAQFRPAADEVAASRAVASPVARTGTPVIWILALIFGGLILLAGTWRLLSGPSCGQDTMQPGDICEKRSSTGRVSESTYEQEQRVSYISAAIGGIAVLGGGAGMVLTRRRNRRAADVAASI